MHPNNEVILKIRTLYPDWKYEVYCLM